MHTDNSEDDPYGFLVFFVFIAVILCNMAVIPRSNSAARTARERLAEIFASRNGKMGLLAFALFSFAVAKLSNYDGDVYKSTPFCAPSPDGNCGESPYVPSPRTKYSAKSKQQFQMWMDFHARLNVSAVEYSSRLKSAKGAKGDSVRPLILLGDSITESFLGSSYGHAEERFRDVPSILANEYGQYDPLVMAISGDQTQHLLWRMLHGGLLPEYADHPDALFVVLIGTNNIGSGHLPHEATKGVMAVAEYLVEHTRGRMILLELLPRGDSHRTKFICPPRCGKDGKPFRSFMPAVNKVNSELREKVSNSVLFKEHKGRVSLVNCGDAFAPDESAKGRGDEVNTDLMPDSLHPNAAGHRALAKCVLECVNRIDGKC